MIDTGTLNFLWSQALVGGFVAAGCEHAVLSPGSRSTPLALALLRQPGLHCHVAVDERCAAFFALGIAKASRRPVLLLATSGTAPANWLPAVIEASQSGVPLITISADRPPELQGCGANQTIDQIGLFGSHVRASHPLGAPHPGFDPGWLHRLAARIVEQAGWPHPGPVHVNQPFREPLLPAGEIPAPAAPAGIAIVHPELPAEPAAIARLAEDIGGRPGFIVCGELPAKNGFPEALTALAGHLACPILAEPLSGLRFGPHERSRLLTRYSTWLADREFAARHRPEWVLRFGTFAVTRHLQNHLADVPIQALVDPWPRHSDPAHRLNHLLRAEPIAACQALLGARPQPCPSGWFTALAERDARPPAAGDAWHIPILVDEIPADSALFIGNSLAIRQFDTHSGSAGRTIHCYGNRGASGIDGNISTALGLGEIHGRVVALLGDLTCQHDLGGLALAAGRDAVIVVVNNGGGGIFDHLPQAALPEFERGWRTPQQISFGHAAATFGLAYARADNATAFRQILKQAFAAGGPQLLEVQVS
jgi:2-succinyl-5-enolpyruvyl-6-hydroxy-3-cyclohexene-1-carboxylate synthase